MERYTPQEAITEAEILQAKINSGEAVDYSEAEKKLDAASVDSPETKTADVFMSDYEKILGTPLTPENIDSYADDAVNALIVLTDIVLETYDGQNPRDLSGKELEDTALRYYGLTNIGETLDYISGKAQEIKKIDDFVGGVVARDRVLVPPVSGRSSTVEGAGNFVESLTIARTKTLLFILGNDFDIDINDSKQLALTTGILTEKMMRRKSYSMIEVPKLERVILCCDEEGNVTYIFNNALLRERGTSGHDIANLNKTELDKLIKSEPNLGRRVIYSNRFVNNIVGLIKNIDLDEKEEKFDNDSDKYLYPKAPEGVLSASAIAVESGIDIKTVTKAIAGLDKSLAGVKQYRFGGQVTAGYNLEQRGIISQLLREQGHFSEKAPVGILSINGVADSLGVGYRTVAQAINELGDSIGQSKKYKFGTRVASGYSLEQQNIISKRLEEQGLLASKAPEGVLSNAGIARELGLEFRVVTRVIKELGSELGDTKIYKFSSNPVTGYTPEQQDIIKQRLEEGGYLSEKAPEGVLSNDGIARKLRIGDNTSLSAIEALGGALGQVRNYKFGSQVTAGYTPEQQSQIIGWLKKQGLLSERVPEGILSRKGISVALGLHEKTVQSAITGIAGDIGETEDYKFGPATATGYTPEQQKMIEDYLVSHSLLSEKAPSTILSVKGIASLYGLDRETITTVISELGESLGDTKEYKFYSNITTGYTPEQQNMIRDRLEERGNLLPKKPEDFASKAGLARRFGKGESTITRAILELGEDLGEVKTYGYGAKPGVAYSPAQQEMIRKNLEENGLLVGRAPSGYLSAHSMSRIYGRGTKTILEAISDLQDKIGVTKKYIFGVKVAIGYSPDQQAMIKSYLDNR